MILMDIHMSRQISNTWYNIPVSRITIGKVYMTKIMFKKTSGFKMNEEIFFVNEAVKYEVEWRPMTNVDADALFSV